MLYRLMLEDSTKAFYAIIPPGNSKNLQAADLKEHLQRLNLYGLINLLYWMVLKL